MNNVSVIIPVYNDSATLAGCLESLLANSGDIVTELIVVDDGSTDRSGEVAAAFPGVRVIRKSRGGAASAVNAGIRAANPENDIVRVHADVAILTPDWVQKLQEVASAADRVGVVGARLVLPDGRIQTEGRTIISGLGFHSQHRNLKAHQPNGAPTKPRQVDTVSGAACYYTRAAITAVGGFDENYAPAYVDDDDFCIAARFRGFAVFVHGGVEAVHYTTSQSAAMTLARADTEAEIKKLTGAWKEMAVQRHAPYWEAKWGWNPFRPDLGEIRRIYGGTEICWAIGEALKFRSESAFPSVDCCLVTWNTLPLLKRCLESLGRTDYPADRLTVYVADNSSTDGTVAYLRDLAATYPFKLVVIELPVNTGAPLGVNFAVAGGRGQLVARLDDDIVLPPDWLKPLVQDFFVRPYAGCVGPKIINDDDKGAIQCGPYRHFPEIFGHDDEVDAGQANYLSRTTHVRGCCNLYRRDAFQRCGLFDLRYSPSQCDDPDHHIALLQAGFEIIYDGRVSVIHKLNNGLARSLAAVANQRANLTKLIGKWGRDAYELLESAIDLSREGRYLPDDGNTEAWLACAPDRRGFPRQPTAVASDARGLQIRIYEEIVQPPSLAAHVEEYLAVATDRQDDGSPRLALEVLNTALSFAPSEVRVFRALAEAYHTIGQSEAGGLVARYGLLLHKGDGELARLLAKREWPHRPMSGQTNPTISNQIQRIGESGDLRAPSGISASGGLRVLMVNTFRPRLPGGDQSQLKKTKQYLEQLGLRVDVSCSPRPDPRGYDLVHVWNTWFPQETLTQVKGIRATIPDIPIVLSPIYWNIREKTWADSAVPWIFSNATNPAQLDLNLNLLASGKLVHNGTLRGDAAEGPWRGFETYQRQLFGLVDHLLPQSQVEIANLKATLGIEMPHTVVRNSAETKVFDPATPDAFVQEYGIKDFIITVGLIEPRKNQLMLLYALKDQGIPIVVVGRYYNRAYYNLCRKYAPKGTIFIDHLPHEKLASALKAARMFCLPSWMECASLANIEAGLCGCSLVVSDRTSEREYFGGHAYYCDPASVTSIRNAVLSAHRNHGADASKRRGLINELRSSFTWARAAEATLAGYQTALVRRGRLGVLPASAGPAAGVDGYQPPLKR